MPDSARELVSVDSLKSGDYVLVFRDGEHRFSGYIEPLFPRLNLTWINDPAGYRRLIDPSDFTLYQPRMITKPEAN